MKLKFRADSKDLLIFCMFAVFLLYFVAIAVLNAVAFVQEGTLAGLNPLPAFSREYIGPTMVLYFAILIAVFTSVSSYFFEREKGFGISTGAKNEKGYSRWATDKEMKAQLKLVNYVDETCEIGGIPLINTGKELWVDTSGYHNMIIGSTGSGKSQSISFPFIRLLAKAGESMIITDPKGELYEGTTNELRERGYNIVLLNFRDPQKGNCWNPFSIPYKLYTSGNKDKAIELVEDLAKNILYDEKNKGNDPFWENTSADYFAGLAISLFNDAREEEVNLNSINLMASIGEEKIGASNYMKEYFSTLDPTSPEYIKAKSTVTAPSETKGSILSVFSQKIQLFSSRENLSEMLSHSDFDMEDIGRKKTAVFIVVQDEKKTYHSLVTIFLKQCYETLVRVAQEQPGFKLKYRTNFLLDEFANMPPLSDVDAMVSAARSRNIKLSFIIQNFSQLNDVYGKEKAETIRGNCGNTIFLLSTELAALEEISKMCGEVKSKKDDKTDSRPLVTVTDLQNLKEEQAIILRSRMRPYKTTLLYDYKISWGKKYPKAEYPTREKRPIQVFDLKAVVDKRRQEKMQEMLGGTGLPNMPGMGMMPGMPSFPGMPGMSPSMPGMSNFSGMPGMGSSIPNMNSSTPPFPGLSPMMADLSNNGGKGPQGMPGGINVDDLVSRIDKRIAELEEQERLEKEKLAKEQQEKEVKKGLTVSPGLEKIANNKKNTEEKESLKLAETKENRISIDQQSQLTLEPSETNFDVSHITDDQFFDDFFSDDEE